MHGQSNWTKPNLLSLRVHDTSEERVKCVARLERFAAIELIGDAGKNLVGVSALHMPRGLEPRVRRLIPIELSTYHRAA